MNLMKRTYALPPDVLERFERAVDSGGRSAIVAALLNGWIEEREREILRRDIEEGCRDMWDVYRETAQEWEPLDREADCTLDR